MFTLLGNWAVPQEDYEGEILSHPTGKKSVSDSSGTDTRLAG